MALVNARAAFESAIQTAVAAADNTVSVIFDNMPFSTPGKNTKYVIVSITFNSSTQQPQGVAQDFYSGSIRCGIFTPSNIGSAAASAIAEAVIDGITSVNATNYVDTYNCKPRAGQVTGPTSVTTENDSHFLSVVGCTFTANA